ncbi:hypothetical protein OSB04_025693 [Centaurea solstitialis]|uniref:Bromo domain-containing protein n=1 Tax=Centaurea solstitialis TaxID=347529 RepID=A0AA38T1Y0_9ASTR|nr:hypothetical protein OSB04_025693 [Centaurea solstitialis]
MGNGGGDGGGSGRETTAKRRKGRPSRSELQKRAIVKQQLQNQQKSSSTRRNPNSTAAAISGDNSANGDESSSSDDERKEKKVKLVVRLPQSSDLIRSSSSFSVNSASSGSDSNANVDNCKINSGSGNIIIADDDDNQGEKTSKATDNVHGSPMESGPTTPLPDKKLLVFILDRLQKKDTYGVFSEPVDPDELPDYHELIEHPMDFGTVRRKLDEGLYSNLDELEADVFLICSNGMQYNSSDTIYFRQARTIQELAKRDFGNLRHEGDDGEPQPKVVKRGRPPSKHLKQPPGLPPVDRAGPESTSGATLATAEDNTTESTPYNLRRGPMYRHHADGFLGSHRNRNGELYSESMSDWNEEFPARIRRADMKYGNKNVIIDETRRDTYKQYLSSIFADEQFLLPNFRGERKRLMAVGLHLVEHGYAESLVRFAANLGPVVRKVASKKIEKVLPPGVKSSFFPSGNCIPGLVSDMAPKRIEIPSTSGSNPDIGLTKLP